MPWPALAHLTKSDALAIAAEIPGAGEESGLGPFGPNERPSSVALKVTPPDAILPR
jgi:hypothetical protein